MKENEQYLLPENDDDLYGDDISLEDVQKRMEALRQVLINLQNSPEIREAAGKRLDDLVDLYVEFLD